MARFLGSVEGTGSPIKRLGSESSGLCTVADGWDFGVCVLLFVDENGKDCAEIILTGGSNARHSSRSLGVFSEEDLEKGA